MLTESQIAEFHQNGFIKTGRVLDDAHVEVLRWELGRVIGNRDGSGGQPVHIVNLTGETDAAVWQIVNIWQASPPFEELMRNSTLTEEVAQLTGANELRIWHDQVQYKPAGCGGVNMWHQDNPYWPIIDPPTQVTAWVALDDVDEGNGCMSMIPGSHLWGDQIEFLHTLKDFESMPKVFEGRTLEVVLCPVRKGEVHYHHCLAWHGSHANKSDRPRRAIAFHYMTEETFYVAGGEHVMKPFVQVGNGEILKGPRFPLVWSREAVRA
jgi:ectoine hydroxylase-related dioxygenase (phytanoyl-CoA dioxygenase family)